MDFQTNIISDDGNKLDVDVAPNGVYATDANGSPFFLSWNEWDQMNRRMSEYQAHARRAAE